MPDLSFRTAGLKQSADNYNESVRSKWESIRLDGPGIYTSLLEISDNSID